MRQIKLMGLAMAAVLALGAVAVTLASAALPEFDGPFPIHFVSKQLSTGTLETKEGNTVSCTGGSALGFIRSAKDLLVSGKGITYTGCSGTGFGEGECKTTGAANGEITTSQLLGLLGYITKPSVGILFEPDNAPDFASFNCETLLGPESLLIKGTVICPLSPVNTLTDSFTLNCSQTKGVQNPLKFEGGTGTDTLLTEGKGPDNFAFEQSGIASKNDILTLTRALILG